jgi:F-type H+-transporting ATPase subunit gamma
MASQREIRRRIGAVRNIRQATRAMQFVAASKLKRAQDSAVAARPYAEKIDEVLADVAAVLGQEDHPLLAQREGGPRWLVLFTTDRGFAGALNTNAIRAAQRQLVDGGGEIRLVTIGRKGRDAMRRFRVPIEATFEGFGDRPSFADVLATARLISDAFVAGSVGRVDLVYSTFVSTLVQRARIEQLLPVQPTEDLAGIPGRQFIFEPSAAAVLEQLLPRYVATRIFRAVLENLASEQSARMIAMKNATDNAGELIDDLTLTYNKVRQANITREMIEIATGAQAS